MAFFDGDDSGQKTMGVDFGNFVCLFVVACVRGHTTLSYFRVFVHCCHDNIDGFSLKKTKNLSFAYLYLGNGWRDFGM